MSAQQERSGGGGTPFDQIQQRAARLDAKVRLDAQERRDEGFGTMPHTCSVCGVTFETIEDLATPDLHGPAKGGWQ